MIIKIHTNKGGNNCYFDIVNEVINIIIYQYYHLGISFKLVTDCLVVNRVLEAMESYDS